jgi:hypothetical protein
MQGNDNIPAPDTDDEDTGIGAEPVEHKSVKAPRHHHSGDSNPDKV